MRFRRVAWTALMAAMILLAACQSFEGELKQARELRQADKPSEARRVALDIIKRRPRTTAAWLSLVESDLALAEKVQRRQQPDTASFYLVEAARAAIAHLAHSKSSQKQWNAAASSVFRALAEDLKQYMRHMKRDATLASRAVEMSRNRKAKEPHLALSRRVEMARREAPQLVRRVLLYRELLRRLPEPAPGDLADLERESDDLMKHHAEALQLDPRLREDLAGQLQILLDEDFKRLLVARRRLGDIPLEMFLDTPWELSVQ